jgi:Fe-S cluster assembly scaffold protein SufB
MNLNDIQKYLLKEVADMTDIPTGAYNIRSDSTSIGRQSTENVEIIPKEGISGIDIFVKPDTKGETIHIPVVMTQSGLKEKVYNDFYIGDNADVEIVAGCGIDNCGAHDSQHDGIHRFYIGKGSKVRYTEKHYGSGSGTGKRLLNPVTEVYMEEGSSCEMEMVQIKGVDNTARTTVAELKKDASLVVRERLMTHGEQTADSAYTVSLNGDGSNADIVSRGVARDDSYQRLDLKIIGNAACKGHTECDSIIMDNGRILAVPALEANNTDSSLVHEAAIGKIAGEQLTKLMTLGLTEAEAEEQIINGFLR